MKAEAAKLQGAGIPAKPCPMERVEWRGKRKIARAFGKVRKQTHEGRWILIEAGGGCNSANDPVAPCPGNGIARTEKEGRFRHSGNIVKYSKRNEAP